MFVLGTNTVGIGLVVKLRDNFTANANRVSGSFQKLYGNAQRVLKANLVAARQVGLGMTIAGLAGIKAFAGAVDVAAEFNYTLKGVQAVTNATTRDMKSLHDMTLEVGMSSKFTAQQVAAAEEFLAKSGFRIRDIKEAIKGVTEFGAAGDLNIEGKEGAAGIMANVLNTWGFAANQSSKIADIMTESANKSSIDIVDMAEAIKYVGGAATTLKIPFEDISSMIAVLGNRGMRGSMAGVGLANMMLYLSKAVGVFRTQRQSDALKMLGLNPQELMDAKGNLLPMIQVVDKFRESLSRMSTTKQLSILEGLMNIRGARAFIPLFRDTKIGLGFADMLAHIRDNSAGAAKRMADMKMDTLKGDVMVLSDTWDAFRVTIGETLEPIVRFGVKFITSVLQPIIRFAKTPFGKAITVVAAGLSILVGIGGAMIVGLTTVRLLTMSNTVTGTNMGRALAWAWNTANAAALRYITTARGAMLTNVGGGTRWRDIKTGRFIKGPAAAGASGGIWNGMKSLLSKFGGSLGGITRLFGGLFKVGSRFFGLMAGAVAVLVTMVGFKNVIKGIIYAMGTFLQALMIIPDYLLGIPKHGILGSAAEAMKTFKSRNALLRGSLGFEETPIEQFTKNKNKDPYLNTRGLKERMDTMLLALPPPKPSNVTMDGKKVGSVIWEQNREDLQRLLEVKN
jgi:TP901 family phage tail tape measure protein